LYIDPVGLSRVLNKPVRRLELIVQVRFAVDGSGNLRQRVLSTQSCERPRRGRDQPEAEKYDNGSASKEEEEVQHLEQNRNNESDG
jgi:hypothetical protein